MTVIEPRPAMRLQRLAVLLAVAGVHGWLLFGGRPPAPRLPVESAAARITVRLVADRPLPAAARPGASTVRSPSVPPPRATPARRVPAAAISRPADSPSVPALPVDTAVDAREVPPPALTAATAASAAPQERLIDTAATRGALRKLAREVPVAEQAALASSAPPVQTAEQRLAQDIAQAGKGDCAKGEYAGAGMGVLSLPFLVAAKLRDQCAK
jgi:hypothetical protein